MTIYFFVIFEVYYMTFRYDVFLDEYIDLSLKSISGSTLEDNIEPMKRIEKKGSKKKSFNNNLIESSIQQNIECVTTLILQSFHIFVCICSHYE